MFTVVVTEGSFEELLKWAGTGSVIELGEYNLDVEESDWVATSHGIVFSHDCEVFYLNHEFGSQTTLGKHEFDGFSFLFSRLIIENGNKFSLVDPFSHSAKLVGEYEWGGWSNTLSGIIIKREDEFFIVSFEDGTEKSLGEHVCDDWEVGPSGIIIKRNDQFTLVSVEDGSEKSLGEHECGPMDIWEVFRSGIIIERCEEFFLVNFEDGSEKSLGTYKCDGWSAGDSGFVFVYDRKFSLVVIKE